MKMNLLLGQSLQETTLANTPMMVSVMRAHIAHTEQTPVIVVPPLATGPMVATAARSCAARALAAAACQARQWLRAPIPNHTATTKRVNGASAQAPRSR